MCTMIFFSMKMLSGQQSHFTLETCFPHFLGSLLSVFMMGGNTEIKLFSKSQQNSFLYLNNWDDLSIWCNKSTLGTFQFLEHLHQFFDHLHQYGPQYCFLMTSMVAVLLMLFSEKSPFDEFSVMISRFFWAPIGDFFEVFFQGRFQDHHLQKLICYQFQ